MLLSAFLSSEAYDSYWLEYLRHHRKAGTRHLHVLGTGFGILGGALALIAFGFFSALIVGLIGYTVAIASHFLVERNRPFGKKPLWGLLADFRMIKRTLTGEIQADLKRL
jgi:hypothetical protein